MRTTLSRIEFEHPFTLNRDIGELPAGTYELEIDEEEMQAADRTVRVRVGAHLFVRNHGSMRMIAVDFDQVRSALANDAIPGQG